jgi:hypothetical protein
MRRATDVVKPLIFGQFYAPPAPTPHMRVIKISSKIAYAVGKGKRQSENF